MGCKPKITGEENILVPAIYVCNHCSWMDVPSVTFIWHKAKYFAKGDLASIPVIGTSLTLGKHMILDRDDKRAQLEALMKGVAYAKNGSSIFIFPEGTRSKDGRLSNFKMGAFKLALKSGLPIVPVTISGNNLVMPPEVLFPQQPGNNLVHMHIHPAINTKGKTERELSDLLWYVMNQALPKEQQGNAEEVIYKSKREM